MPTSARTTLLAAVLLLPISVLAQRPTSSGPPPEPAKPSSPAPTPSPSPAPSRSESPHIPTASPSPVATRPEPSRAPSVNNSSSAARAHSDSDHSAPRAHDAHPPKPEPRISSAPAANSSPRVPTPEREPREPKTPEPDLARNACKHAPCTTCPPGQSLDKDGKCIATPVQRAPMPQCLAGPTWNSPACVSAAQSTQCAAGEQWNGVSCENTTLCVSFESRGQLLAAEARSVSAQMLTPCLKNPMGKACRDLTQTHDEILMRYRMLLSEVPPSCHVTLPDPLSL